MEIDDKFHSHIQQRYFLEDYLTSQGSQLKEMNKRKDQSIHLELDTSQMHNNSLVEQDNKIRIIPNLTQKILLNGQKNNFDNSSYNKHVEFQFDQLNQLATQNERTFTAYSATNINDAKYKDDDQLKQDSVKIRGSQTQVAFDRKSLEGKDEKKQSFKKPKKSILGRGDLLSNPSNFQNMTLIPKIRKKMNYFYQMFTQSGRRKFLEHSKVRKQIQDPSENILNSSANIFTKINSLFNKFLEYYEGSLMKNIPLIDTYGNLSFSLLMFFSIFNSLFFYFLSLIIVFGGPDDYLRQIFYFTATVWIVETLLKINTKIYKPFKAEYTRKKILQLYLKNRAFFDIIPIGILFYLPSFQFESLYLKIIVFIKMKNLISDIYDMQKQLCMMFKDYFFIKLVNLIIQLFVIGHILACVWYLLGLIEMVYLGEPSTWYYEGLSNDLIWWKLYLAAVYWSLTLMTTGSNIANTVTQMTFTCIIMLFTTIIFGYLLNIIGIILSELDKQNETKNRDINLVNQYMRQKNISRTLKTRVNMDIEYYYSNNSYEPTEEDLQVLKKLPSELNDLLFREYSKQIISKIEFLTQNFSEQLVDDLGFKMQEVQYFPNQIIYQEDDYSNPSLMFVLSGEVNLYQKIAGDINFQKAYRQVKKGELFGQVSFFTGQCREGTAKTSKYTRIIKIYREDFLQLMKKESKDYEIFCQLKDNILLYDNFKDINLPCNICSAHTHQELNCVSVHFSKDFAIFKSQYSQRVQQFRSSFERRRLRMNSLHIMAEAEQAAKNLIENEDLNSVGSQIANQSFDEQSKMDEQDEKYEDKFQLSSPIDPIQQRKKSILGEQALQRRPSLLKHYSQNNEQSPSSKEKNEYQNSSFAIRQSSFYERQQYENTKTEQIELKSSYHTTQQFFDYASVIQKEINPWLFENLNEYTFYFPKGNSKLFFVKANKYIRSNLNLIIKRRKVKLS